MVKRDNECERCKRPYHPTPARPGVPPCSCPDPVSGRDCGEDDCERCQAAFAEADREIAAKVEAALNADMNKYILRVFDGNPGAVGPCEWLDDWGFDDLDDLDDQLDLVRLEAQNAGYEPTDRLWWVVFPVDDCVDCCEGSLLVESSHETPTPNHKDH